MSWGCYRVPAAVRAPARDAANRLRAWVVDRIIPEVPRLEANLAREVLRAASLERQLGIEKDRVASLQNHIEDQNRTIAVMRRDRDQFEKQVRNRERNVAVKEQQLQKLEEQIQQAYNNGVRDGKYERAALQEQAATGDRAAARALHEPITRDDISKAYDSAMDSVRRMRCFREPISLQDVPRARPAIEAAKVLTPEDCTDERVDERIQKVRDVMASDYDPDPEE